MKITRKIAWAVVLPALLAALAAAAVVVGRGHGWPLPLEEQPNDGGFEHFFFIVTAVLALVWLGAASLLVWGLLRKVLRPVAEASRFASRLAAGDTPEPLSFNRVSGDEVRALFAALDSLRCRQQDLRRRLKESVVHEIVRHRELEHYDSLLLNMMSRLLPESRRSLGVIQALAQVELLDHPDPEAGGTMHQLLERISALSLEIEQIFDLSRLDREHWQDPVTEEFSGAQFARDLVNRCAVPLHYRGVELATGFSTGVPDRLCADRELLFQSLNLLIRAVGRAAGAGGRVTFSREFSAGRVCFEIRDSRSAPCRERLAEKFQALEGERPDQVMSSSELGISLLGLGIVRDVAKRMNCDLEVAEDRDSFTVIRYRLPASGVAATCGEALPAGEAQVMALPERDVPAADGGLQVLLLDSDPEEAAAYARLLAAKLIRTTAVQRYDELRSRLDAEPFDAVILIEPERDSDALPDELRRLSGKRNLPIVVVASQFAEEVFHRCVRQGRVWCLNMPLDFRLLCRILHQAVGR